MRADITYDPSAEEVRIALPLRADEAMKEAVRKAVKPDREYESVGGFTVMVKSVADEDKK